MVFPGRDKTRNLFSTGKLWIYPLFPAAAHKFFESTNSGSMSYKNLEIVSHTSSEIVPHFHCGRKVARYLVEQALFLNKLLGHLSYVALARKGDIDPEFVDSKHLCATA